VLEAKIVAFLRDQALAAAEGLDDGDIDFGDASEFEALSIHSLLGLKLVELEDGTTKCERGYAEPSISEYELVVVDEASMVDATLFKAILQFRGRARILFIGDPAQLPPVGSVDFGIAGLHDADAAEERKLIITGGLPDA
jgi:ATP-dependent exoDNAse (exonuclease V) alpha subunit